MTAGPPPSPHPNEARWAALMRAAQDGDKTAYRTLLLEIAPQIRAIIRSIARTTRDPEDIVQDVLLSLHLVRHTYDPARPFRPWLHGIVRHRTLDAIRRQSRRGRNETTVEYFPETSTEDEAKDLLEQKDDAAALRAAIARLPDGQRMALELLKLREFTLVEAAAETGMSIAALKVATHRAIKALRVMMKWDGPDQDAGDR